MQLNTNIEHQSAPVLPKRENMLDVAGTYQIYEFHKISGKKQLVPLPIMVTVTLAPELLKLEIYDETSNTTKFLNYPMKNVPCWSEERKALIYCRPVDNGYRADLIFAPGMDKTLRTTYRVTWQVDAEKRIHEIFEEFDANGNKLETSFGHKRVLIPISKN